jgi:hypothetical protein
MRQLGISIALLCLFLSACTVAPTATPIPPTRITESTSTTTLTPSPMPSSTPMPTSTRTVTPMRTATRTATPTPLPQTLGRIFPEQFHGQAVWSNAGGDRNDQGWHCPDVSKTDCQDLVIHFDVSLPNGFGRDDYVLSPVDGYVYRIYEPGNGQAIWIMPEPGFAGVEALLGNRKRIETLAHGIFEFKYQLNDVNFVSLHLAHVIPLVKQGDKLKRGEPLARVAFDVSFKPPKVAYVIYIHTNNGKYFQFGPCDVPNEDEFCGKCTPGSPYPCP